MTVDVLLPTCDRLASFIMTLSGVAAQSVASLHVVVADQSIDGVGETPVVTTLFRVIEARGGAVEYHHRPQVHGIAEQRAFLLGRARSRSVLYLDDDVLMEPWVIERLQAVIDRERCGFVGAFPAGLSYGEDVRPAQQAIEYWEGPGGPEVVEPESAAWERWHLHRAANLFHVAQAGRFAEPRLYKVAWLASCILYDRQKLLDVGGFDFWPRLPRYHSGEEVVVQNLLMRRWGGCGMIPSGTYYAEVPSTVLNDRGTVDGHALSLLADLVATYAPQG
jgi:hypothetical protein